MLNILFKRKTCVFENSCSKNFVQYGMGKWWVGCTICTSIKYGHEILYSMYRSHIPYLATFWIVGSRAGGLKIGPILFCALQIAPKISCYKNWQADLRVGWLNFALLLFRVLQTTLRFSWYTNWQTDSRDGGIKIVIV